jgi:hypothetical protein
VPVLGLFGGEVLGELRVEILGTDFVEYEVVESGHGAAATAGQSGIGRDRDAERRVVSGRGQTIVRRVEVAEPAAEVADRDADAREQLLLHRDAHLPVVVALAPAVNQIGIERLREDFLPEVLVVHAAAFEVRVRVDQIAVGNVVAVARIAGRECGGVVPRAGRLQRHTDQWVEIEIAIAGGERREVFADVDLERRLAVAEQII